MTAAEESPRPEEAKESGVARFWDARAAQYDDHYDTIGPDGYSLRARLALTLRLVGEGRGGAVLDVGMGAGRLCASLAQQGWAVSGVDVSEEMVELARDRLPEARERLVRASAEHLPFPDESFDAVTATGSLEYTDVPRALAELSRVLRPGGSAVVSYPNPAAPYSLWKTRIWYPAVAFAKGAFGRSLAAAPKGGMSLSPNGFTQVLRSSGFRVESVQHTSYLLLPAPLDEFLPGVTTYLGGKLEGGSDWMRRMLGTQVLYVGTKPTSSEHASTTPTNQVEERADG